MVSKILSLAFLSAALTSSALVYNPPYVSLYKTRRRTMTLHLAESPNESFRNQILSGAALKLKEKRSGDLVETTCDETVQSNDISDCQVMESNFTYTIRKARRSEINEITDTLMKAFHPHEQPIFDTYIRKYKYNHLQMCFYSIPENDIGMFVACASSDLDENRQIVGFCSVDGRPNDGSSKPEFVTASTLANNCPRPYLSDLGVLPSHRRKGIGQALVGVCEEWALERGHKTMYLKVDETNKDTMRLYNGLGYERSRLPGLVVLGSGGKRWGNDVLLEKNIGGEEDEVKKRKVWFKRIWRRKETAIR